MGICCPSIFPQPSYSPSSSFFPPFAPPAAVWPHPQAVLDTNEADDQKQTVWSPALVFVISLSEGWSRRSESLVGVAIVVRACLESMVEFEENEGYHVGNDVYLPGAFIL
jgi:hypothetical protein